MKNISKTQPAFTKRRPHRTCIACRSVKEKRELIRLVHGPDGNIEIDKSNKKDGRGAYLCHEWQCWETGLKENKIEYHLKCRITPVNREQLIKEAKDILQGAN